MNCIPIGIEALPVSSKKLFAPQRHTHYTTFYSFALRVRLREQDIGFATDGTAEMKLDVLDSLMKIHLTAKMLGDYNNSQSLLITDKLAGRVTSNAVFM